MSESIDSEKSSNFSGIIEELIARDLRIDPSEVTPEFIHEWRQKHLYPNAQHGLNAKYGGYNTSGRRILSLSEIKALRESAERFIQSLQTPSQDD